MNTTNPAFGIWPQEDPTPCRCFSREFGLGWPPKTAEGYSNPYGAAASPEQSHARRGFKTDRVTHDLANAFLRGSIYDPNSQHG
jgi:hypothetical protein